MENFTREELTQFDGEDGKRVYIAHDGKVYDVSESKMWRGGMHMKRHHAGRDLTTEIQAAPHDESVLERYPQVGFLIEEKAPGRQIPRLITWLLETSPFFRRHPHPMTVHFPITFLLSFPFFNVLFLMTGNRDFETTAFYCLGGGILFTAVAMITGFFTWWYNYMGRMMKPVVIKIPLSIVTLVLAIVLFTWRWSTPDLMANPGGADILYFLGSLAFIPLIVIIGWYGATMTFPMEKR